LEELCLIFPPAFCSEKISVFDIYLYLCQVTESFMRLHIDGDLITEAHLCSLSNELDHQDGANLISLVGSDDMLEGYVYNIVVVHTLGTIQEQCVKVIILATIMAFLLVSL
jgi:hypothetical protein